MKPHPKNRTENLLEIGLYIFVGGLSCLTAFYLATGFTKRSPSQEKPIPTLEKLYQQAQPNQKPEENKKSPIFDEAMLKRISNDPDLLNQTLESVYEYDPKGKRDPFQPYFGQTELTPGEKIGPLTHLQRFDLKDLKLIGIIWDVARPKAMILDPGGNVHIVEVNSKMGRNNAYVGAIREGEIVIVQPFEEDGKKSYNTKVIAIGKAD